MQTLQVNASKEISKPELKQVCIHQKVNDVTAAQSSRHDKYLHECTATAKIEQKSLWFLSTPSVDIS